jgi:hypothetical protein
VRCDQIFDDAPCSSGRHPCGLPHKIPLRCIASCISRRTQCVSKHRARGRCLRKGPQAEAPSNLESNARYRRQRFVALKHDRRTCWKCDEMVFSRDDVWDQRSSGLGSGAWRALATVAILSSVCAVPRTITLDIHQIPSEATAPANCTFPPLVPLPIHTRQLHTRNVQLNRTHYVPSRTRLPHRDATSTRTPTAPRQHNGWPQQGARHRLCRMDSRRAPSVQ